MLSVCCAHVAATVTGAAAGEGPEKTTLCVSAKATKSMAIWPGRPVSEMCSLRGGRTRHGGNASEHAAAEVRKQTRFDASWFHR